MNGYFFDMDGTLYNNKFHEVSEKTFKMLNELQRQEHFVALCTSRCQTELKNLPSCMRNFQFDCMISDGGALILDRHKEVLEMNCISKATMKTIDSFCRENGLVYSYYPIMYFYLLYILIYLLPCFSSCYLLNL